MVHWWSDTDTDIVSTDTDTGYWYWYSLILLQFRWFFDYWSLITNIFPAFFQHAAYCSSILPWSMVHTVLHCTVSWPWGMGLAGAVVSLLREPPLHPYKVDKGGWSFTVLECRAVCAWRTKGIILAIGCFEGLVLVDFFLFFLKAKYCKLNI